jgi:membrane protein implicated in regulation of membrane protease activity
MSWSDFYLFCFLFGFFFSVLAVVTGHLGFGHDQADIGDLTADVDGGHDFGSDHHHGHVSPFNLGTIAAFLAWFGGTGYLFTRFYTMWFLGTLLSALTAGAAGAWIVFWFLTRVLIREREEMDPADYEMVGVLGHVTSTIRPAGVGEILYARDGARRAVAAKSDDGRQITNGEEVVVTRYENGIAYVRRYEEMG